MRLNNANAAIIEEMKDIAKWQRALAQAASSGKEQGEFTCPLCGGEAWYKTYPQVWPWDKNAKVTRGGCENDCIRVMS